MEELIHFSPFSPLPNMYPRTPFPNPHYRVTKKKDLAKLACCQAIHEGSKKAHLIRKKDIHVIKERYDGHNLK